jgi:hypothetical protein
VPTIIQELGAEVSFDFDGNPLQDASHSDEPVLSQEIAYGPNQISVTENGNHLIHVPVDDWSIVIDFETGEPIVGPEIEEHLLEYVPRERATGSDVDLSEDVQNRHSNLEHAE